MAMKVGVLGTGMVGQTLAQRLVETGYDVMVGARSRESESLHAFADVPGVGTGSFEDAAGFGEVVVNATNGRHSLAALAQAGSHNLDGKPVVDVSNELVPVEGGYPKPVAGPDSSLGQRIQDTFPDAHVVKTLNTMNCRVMADPSIVQGDHVVFLSGDHPGAKEQVRELLGSFGWRSQQILDLGGIETAGATEMMMSAWMFVRIARGRDAPPFNWAIHSG